MIVGVVGFVAKTKRIREHRNEDEGGTEMERSPSSSPIRPSQSGLYDPQASDVPVTVVTALILLLVLCVVALL